MDEILYELRDHAAGLNAGRWDYIFSVIKKFRDRPEFVLPDRAQVTMTVPFMRAYTELLVKTCHRRGAHAIGGMAAFIPSRRDPEVNERRAAPRCARTRSARPATASTAPGSRTRTWCRSRRRSSTGCSATGRTRSTACATDVHGPRPPTCSTSPRRRATSPRRACAATSASASSTSRPGCAGGAAAINNLMEDAATAEISRSQIWQWIHHGRISAARGRDRGRREAAPRARLRDRA